MSFAKPISASSVQPERTIVIGSARKVFEHEAAEGGRRPSRDEDDEERDAEAPREPGRRPA